MGLRQRTAISIIRMQRCIAEAAPQKASSKNRLGKAKHISFRPIDSTKAIHSHSLRPHLKDQETGHRLLQRLRLALHPHPEQNHASKEYDSLQDELLRLSMHISKQKRHTQEEPSLEDLTAPSYYGANEGPERLPYRYIKIVAVPSAFDQDGGPQRSRTIERLDSIPSDLSYLRKILDTESHMVQPPNLTLVSSMDNAAPEASDLLIDEGMQLGHATANLTQQSLQSQGPRAVQISIRPEVALSLLDS